MSYSKDKKEFKALFASMEATAQLFAGVGEYASSTEIGGMMSNLVIGTRRLESRLAELEKRQKETLLNITPFDLKEAKKIVHDLEYQVDEALSIDVSEKPEEKQIDWEEVIKEENTSLGFALSDSNEEFERVRWYLMTNTKENYKKFKYHSHAITEHLEYLAKHLQDTEKDSKLSRSVYNLMIERYRQEEWGLERSSLVYRIKKAVLNGREQNHTDQYTLNQELDSLKASYLNGTSSVALKKLYYTVTLGKNTQVDEITKHRDELTEDDITYYFAFFFNYYTLKNHIETLPLLEPLTGEYEKLFTGLIAEQYVSLIMPLIETYGELDKLSHYGMLMMALIDFDYVKFDKNNKPYIQLKKYVSEKLPNEPLLQGSDQEMIRVAVKNAKGKKFCELEYGEVEGTDYKKSQIANLQDRYWRCFTLLSQGGQILPKERQLAAYLTKPHPEIGFEAIVNNMPDPQYRYWVDFYRSVLRGETLMFPPNF